MFIIELNSPVQKFPTPNSSQKILFFSLTTSARSVSQKTAHETVVHACMSRSESRVDLLYHRRSVTPPSICDMLRNEFTLAFLVIYTALVNKYSSNVTLWRCAGGTSYRVFTRHKPNSTRTTDLKIWISGLSTFAFLRSPIFFYKKSLFREWETDDKESL